MRYVSLQEMLETNVLIMRGRHALCGFFLLTI